MDLSYKTLISTNERSPGFDSGVIFTAFLARQLIHKRAALCVDRFILKRLLLPDRHPHSQPTQDPTVRQTGKRSSRRRRWAPSFIVANLCEKIIGFIADGLHLQLDTVEDHHRRNIRVTIETRFLEFTPIYALFCSVSIPLFSWYTNQLQYKTYKFVDIRTIEWHGIGMRMKMRMISGQFYRDRHGPPILKIELLPVNESEILNAGISRLMPPPPISSTNTFFFFFLLSTASEAGLTDRLAALLFVVGTSQRPLSSYLRRTDQEELDCTTR